MRNKSDTLDKFKVFVTEIENQFNKKTSKIIPTLHWVL